MQFTVSVVLPVYNGEHYVAQALESVFNQTYKDLEVIVVDDGSTDGSFAVLSQYAAVRLITQQNLGVAHARNRGVQEAKGELIAFIDQDDVWYPHKVATQISVFRRFPTVSFVYSDMDLIDPSGRALGRKASESWNLNWIRPFIRGRFHPFPSTVMMKRSIFLQHGGFSTEFIGNAHEDVDLWARLAKHIDFYFIEESLVQYRVQEDKVYSLGKDIDYLSLNCMTLYRRLSKLYEHDPSMKKHLRGIRDFDARRRSKIGKKLAREGDFLTARHHFKIAWQMSKNSKHISRYLRTYLPKKWHSILFSK